MSWLDAMDLTVLVPTSMSCVPVLCAWLVCVACVRGLSQVCRTALVTLAYQAAAMNRDKAQAVAKPRGGGDGGKYPASIVDEAWTAVCDLQSRIIRDTKALGGQTAVCTCGPGKVKVKKLNQVGFGGSVALARRSEVPRGIRSYSCVCVSCVTSPPSHLPSPFSPSPFFLLTISLLPSHRLPSSFSPYTFSLLAISLLPSHHPPSPHLPSPLWRLTLGRPKGTFAECRWRLNKEKAKCSALSFGKDNRCCLHDRTAADYAVAPEAGSRHTVKMIAG
jgi:hypothetical protein